ncbi:HTTM domain-containing protein [Dokdonia sp. Hel_I_53]|uniref:HTTM domain-containing protein n=1 Tax=Dokdonia sp. Hel_I_53 TaxID=1566287 RepID=UPI0011992790|nr:HTTM domain-containing protein [Dokdonia sp. Hel_I_53]TVZ52501.1 vitamin K-dependent gamma-carboxylase-like protein [Dokdonia sp. Hel_I_53]
MNLDKYLFTRIDNSALIVFRVFFGFLITCEAWGALATGWVRRILVNPEFTFNFIGFDFLQTFPGPGPQMYGWFAVMGIFGVMVMLGYKYRIAIIGYAIMWSVVYLMQKTAYNNHYYLLMLLLWIMALLPANAAFSIDARFRESVRDISMPRWVTLLIILQLWIVYTYASIAKLYPDWLDATVPQILMRGRSDYRIVGDLLQERWVHWTISYVGILFDGLIIPLLLWKRTRKWAFFISIFFHLFNSIVFQIGIFPYMSLAFCVFFFEPKTIHRLFLTRWKPYYYAGDTDVVTLEDSNVSIPHYKNLMLMAFGIYFLVQIALPLRQHFIKDKVLWTEEGHRLSWRMMLRSKGGAVTFTMEDKATGKRRVLNYKEYLTKNQQRNIRSKPDIIWQFAQYVKREQQALGKDVAIYVKCRVRVNGRPSKLLIDPEVDLASVKWDHLRHNEWVLDSDGYLDKKSPSVEKYARSKEKESTK